MNLEIKKAAAGLAVFVDGELAAAGTVRQVARSVSELILEKFGKPAVVS